MKDEFNYCNECGTNLGRFFSLTQCPSCYAEVTNGVVFDKEDEEDDC